MQAKTVAITLDQGQQELGDFILHSNECDFTFVIPQSSTVITMTPFCTFFLVIIHTLNSQEKYFKPEPKCPAIYLTCVALMKARFILSASAVLSTLQNLACFADNIAYHSQEPNELNQTGIIRSRKFGHNSIRFFTYFIVHLISLISNNWSIV